MFLNSGNKFRNNSILESLLNKVEAGFKSETLLKGDSSKGAFSWILQIF